MGRPDGDQRRPAGDSDSDQIPVYQGQRNPAGKQADSPLRKVHEPAVKRGPDVWGRGPGLQHSGYIRPIGNVGSYWSRIYAGGFASGPRPQTSGPRSSTYATIFGLITATPSPLK